MKALPSFTPSHKPRWSRFAQVPWPLLKRLVARRQISDGDVTLFTAMLQLIRKHERIVISLAALAAEVGKSVSTVSRRLQRLRAAGLLVIQKRFRPWGYAPFAYVVQPEKRVAARMDKHDAWVQWRAGGAKWGSNPYYEAPVLSEKEYAERRLALLIGLRRDWFAPGELGARRYSNAETDAYKQAQRERIWGHRLVGMAPGYGV